MIKAPSSTDRLNVLGHGIPLDWPSRYEPRFATSFPTAINGWMATPLTVRERQMLQLMSDLTEKPDWQRKIRDKEICAKWLEELRQLDGNADYHVFSKEMFHYV